MQGGPGCVTSASLVKPNQNHSEAGWAMLSAFSRQDLMPRWLFMICPFARCSSWNHQHQTHWGRRWAKHFTAVVSVRNCFTNLTAYFVIQRKKGRKGYSRRTQTIELPNYKQRISEVIIFLKVSSSYFSHFPGPDQKMRIFQCSNRTQTSWDLYCIRTQFFSASPVLVFTMEKFILRSLPSKKQYVL